MPRKSAGCTWCAAAEPSRAFLPSLAACNAVAEGKFAHTSLVLDGKGVSPCSDTSIIFLMFFTALQITPCTLQRRCRDV